MYHFFVCEINFNNLWVIRSYIYLGTWNGFIILQDLHSYEFPSYYVNELGPKFCYNMSRKIFIVNNIFILIIFFKLFCQQWNLREEISQYFVLAKLEGQRNGVFATNSNFLIPFSFKPYGINLWYFKLWLIVWNIKDPQHWVAYEYGDLGFELAAKTHFLYATLLIRLFHLTDHLV